jgi:Ca2+/Na+ antiporter
MGDPQPGSPQPEKFHHKLIWLVAGFLLGVLGSDIMVQSFDVVAWHVRHRAINGSPDCRDPGWYEEVPIFGSAYLRWGLLNPPPMSSMRSR